MKAKSKAELYRQHTQRAWTRFLERHPSAKELIADPRLLMEIKIAFWAGAETHRAAHTAVRALPTLTERAELIRECNRGLDDFGASLCVSADRLH